MFKIISWFKFEITIETVLKLFFPFMTKELYYHQRIQTIYDK